MATVTKRELVIRISGKNGFTQQQVLNVVQALIGEVTDCLAKNETVVLRNFGSFHVKTTKAKIGRNPKNPVKDVPIPARTIVKFKPGKEMRQKVARLASAKKRKK